MSTPGTVIALPSEEDFHKERYKCIQADDGINWYRFKPRKIDWKLSVLTFLACFQTSVAAADCKTYHNPWVIIDCPITKCSIYNISMHDVSSGAPNPMTKNCSRPFNNSDLVQCLTFNANKVHVNYPDKDHPERLNCSIITISKMKGTPPPAPVTQKNVIHMQWLYAIVGILIVGFTLVLLAIFFRRQASRVCRSCLSAISRVCRSCLSAICGGRNGANGNRPTQPAETYPLANNTVGDKPDTEMGLDREIDP